MKRYRGIIKKIGAVTLALAMTATMVPGQASAEESAPAEQDVQTSEGQEAQQENDNAQGGRRTAGVHKR